MNNHERLAYCLNLYFEYSTHKRFNDVCRALEDVLDDLGWDKFGGWADGERIRMEHKKEADKVWRQHGNTTKEKAR